ncbi:Ion transport 2 domain-containing protein [Salinisphaera sp. T5B8]|uniref:potassium channel family protein n=1 Tax=unclassified Salinisphaera TaxID=2649847 RepID=UPI0033419A2A
MPTIILINIVVVTLAVFVHYEFLYRMTLLLPRLGLAYRFRILLGVFGSLCAHAVEVWLFALAYYGMLAHGGFGHFEGQFDGSLLDCAYFSFTTFTTLGFGDIHPLDGVRYLTGIESLTGLMLITWTASFLYLEMQRYWRASGPPEH